MKQQIHPLWYVCLLTRFSMATIVYLFGSKTPFHTIFSVILGLMGAGFLYKSLFGSNNETQVAKVFWHNTRIIHAALYILAAWFAYQQQNKLSALLIGLDIIFSVLYRTLL
jgi:hypothetical protein